MLKNPKKMIKLIKVANIGKESLHVFLTTSGISMKISEKIWLMIMLRVTKNQDFNLSLEDKFSEKPEGR